MHAPRPLPPKPGHCLQVYDGAATFNWRYIFKLKLPLASQRSTDSLYLDLQAWDHALIGEGELIAGARVSIARLCADVWRDRRYLADAEQPLVEVHNGQKRFWLPLYSGGGAAEVEARVSGDVCVSLEAMPRSVAQTRPAGHGRDPPNRNPVLPEPHRNQTQALTARFASVVREEVRAALVEGSKAVIESEIRRHMRQLTPERTLLLKVVTVLSVVVCGIVILFQLVANGVILSLAFDVDLVPTGSLSSSEGPPDAADR